jgi:hypothetical protein
MRWLCLTYFDKNSDIVYFCLYACVSVYRIVCHTLVRASVCVVCLVRVCVCVCCAFVQRNMKNVGKEFTRSENVRLTLVNFVSAI